MSRFGLLLAGCLVLGLALPAAAFDRILLRKGSPSTVTGTVESMTPEVVKINVSSLVQEIPVNNIKEIMFEEDDDDVKKVRSFVRGGALEDALERANGINIAALPRDMIKADVEFYKGLCAAKLAMGGSGDKAQAKALLGAFIGKYKSDNYHWYDASETYGDLCVSMGDYATAATAYSFVAKATFPEYKLRATILEGRALQAQGKHAEALAKFETVIAAGGGTEVDDQKMLAQIGKAASLAATGQAPQGIQIIEGIIEKGNPQDPANFPTFARAYNALGACYRAEKGADSQRAALMAYLHVDLLFPQDPESHAEALYNLTQLWTAMKFPERATKAHALLKDRYPGSRWMQK